MLYILLAIVIAAVIGVFLLYYGIEKLDNDFVGFSGLILSGLAAISAIAWAWSGFAWFSAGYKAEIVNREYGTSYTQAEMFWASDVIDTVRELDRKRYQLNGNLMRDPDKE